MPLRKWRKNFRMQNCKYIYVRYIIYSNSNSIGLWILEKNTLLTKRLWACVLWNMNIQHKQFYVVIIDGWVRQGECYETELRRHLFQFVVLQVPYRAAALRSLLSTFYLKFYKDNHCICKKNWPSIQVCFLRAHLHIYSWDGVYKNCVVIPPPPSPVPGMLVVGYRTSC